MNSGISSLSKLPKGWVCTALGEVVEPSDEKIDPAKAQNMPYIGLEHIGKDNGKIVGCGYANDVRSTKTRFYAGDLLYGRLRPYLNKAHVVDCDGICSTDILVFPASPYLSNKFLLYRILCGDFVSFASHNMSGVQHPRVNFQTLSRFLVFLPSLPEQHRIVAKIEELFTKLDAGVEALKKIKAQLKRYRQSVLKHAFEGMLTEEWRQAHKHELEPASVLLERIKQERHKTAKGKYKDLPPLDTSYLPKLPEGWMWTRVGDTCETTSGGTPSRRKMTYYGGNIPWLKSGELKDNVIKSAEEFITEEGLKNSSTQIIPKGSLLMALYGATVGKLGILAIDAAINQAICAIFTPVQLDKKLLFWYLIKYRYELLAARRGGAQPNISQGIVNNIRLPLSPLPEQKEIVAEIERRFSMADEIEKTVDHSLKQAARLRHSILKRAFEGKLVPQDPNDEPAEKLLERIKTEKTLTDIRKKSEKKTGITARKKRGDKKNGKPTATKRLYDLLKSAGKRMTPGELLELSKFTIEDFYEQLEVEIQAGRIVENRQNDADVFLEEGK